MVRVNILFGGQAGQGANELAETISNILVKAGYYVFNYRDYGSFVRGEHNFNILCISEKPVYSYDNEIDILVALDKKTLDLHSKKLKKTGAIISKEQGLKIDTAKIIEQHKLDKRIENMIFAAVLVKLLGLNINELNNYIDKKFRGKSLYEDDIKAAKIGYDLTNKKLNILPKSDSKEKIILTGSEGISISAIDSGVDIYFAYPMTPATPVMHILAKYETKKDSKFMMFQPENEIAVANMALGASFAGARSMVGTSGGGFDLMSEALSLQGISEIPLVVYLASRPGPGTGIPTYSMQQDINIALYNGHGEFPRAVIIPGDAEECIQATNSSFYLSQKYRTLSIILSDKHVAESKFTLTSVPKVNEIKTNFAKTDKNYAGARCLPGINICKASSYTHDEYGIVSELSSVNISMLDKLNKKTEIMNKEILSKFETIKIYGKNNAKNLIIGAGSVKGVILDSLDEINSRFLQIIYLAPLDIEKIKKEIKNCKGKIYVVEYNSTGQLAQIIEDKCRVKVEKILKYDARPFTPKDIIKRVH